MILEETSSHMMHFATNHLEKKQTRDDHLELLELFLLLGETPSRGSKFCVPGLLHHTCWLSKLFYILKT